MGDVGPAPRPRARLPQTPPLTREVDLSSTETRPGTTPVGVPAARRRDTRPTTGGRTRHLPVLLPDLLISLGALVAALVVFSWRLGTASPWRDEAVTIAVASRTPEQIWDLVQRVDLVHAPFYFLSHALFGADVDIVQARSISVVAAALTAPLLYGVTRRLALSAVPAFTARLTGATAAALFVAMPFVSRYAQEARPYALATLLATFGTYALVRRWWIAYALSIPVLISLNTVAALVLLAHAGWALASGRKVLWRAAVAAVAGLLVSIPLLRAQNAQSGQVAFLQRPELEELGSHVVFALGSSTTAVVLAGLALVLSVWRARARRLLLVGLLWGALPWPLLWTISQVHPLWTTRYLVFVTPGTALLLSCIVTALVKVRWTAVAAAVLVGAMAVTGLRMQFVFRSPTIGHAEDLRGTAEYVATHAQPGDGLLFLPDGEYRYRILTQLYPEVFEDLDDIALARTATDSATLVGTTVEARFLWQHMAGVGRIWVIGGVGPVVTQTAEDAEMKRLLDNGYDLVSTENKRAFSVKLYDLKDTGVTPAP